MGRVHAKALRQECARAWLWSRDREEWEGVRADAAGRASRPVAVSWERWSFIFKIFIYLARPGLSRDTWDL